MAKLIKMLATNEKRTSALVEILSDTETQASLSKKKPDLTENTSQAKMNDNDYLKKYYQTSKGGPNHSIAQNRAHHLTKFLRQYLLNAFQSGQFREPEIPKNFQESSIDSNEHVKDKYMFTITNVELLADLTKLKIFWSNSGNEELDVMIESYLESQLKNQIRSHLTSQRIMNYVPVVVFVRDRSKVLSDKLDEFLMKLKIENENVPEQGEKKKETEQHIASEKNDMKHTESKDENKLPTIDNLYGVDFNRLMNIIKNNNDHVTWTPETPVMLTNELLVEPRQPPSDSKFQVSLKNFQIHQRQKRERISRRAILLLETQKYYEDNR